MKPLLLGATGRTGKLILDYALEKGMEVTCLVRDKSKVPDHEQIRCVEGSPDDRATLEKALIGCDSIINALNISRTSDFPWAKLRTPKNLLSDTMKNLIPLAEEANVRRIVVCSAWGVGDSRTETPGWFNWFIDHSNIGAAYSDHERQEDLLRASNLDWTIVRPSGLTNSKKDQKVIESYSGIPKPKMTISRRSVAIYMVDALSNNELIGKIPTISA